MAGVLLAEKEKHAANTHASASPDENDPSDEDMTLFYRNQIRREYKRDESYLRRKVRKSTCEANRWYTKNKTHHLL